MVIDVARGRLLVIVWGLINDAKQALKVQPYWNLNFIHMEGNQVAHLLAKYQLLLSKEQGWIENFPNVITQAIIAETII